LKKKFTQFGTQLDIYQSIFP